MLTVIKSCYINDQCGNVIYSEANVSAPSPPKVQDQGTVDEDIWWKIIDKYGRKKIGVKTSRGPRVLTLARRLIFLGLAHEHELTPEHSLASSSSESKAFSPMLLLSAWSNSLEIAMRSE